MKEKAIEDLTQFVREASPQVWEAAKSQTLAEMILAVIWLMVASVLLYIGYKLNRKYVAQYPNGEGLVFTWIVTVVGIFFPFILWGTNLDLLVHRVIAYDYAVIENVLSLLP